MLAARQAGGCQEASGKLVDQEDMRLEGMRVAVEDTDHGMRAVEEGEVGHRLRRAAAGARPAVAKQYALGRMLAIVPKQV